MQQQQTLSSAVQEPLTPPRNTGRGLSTWLNSRHKNKLASAWTYQAEPRLINLPPHLTQIPWNARLYYSNGSVFVVYTNPQALHHHKGYDPETEFCSEW